MSRTNTFKVGINAHALGMEVGGDKSYIENVIRSIGAVDVHGNYTLFLGQPLPTEPIAGADTMKRVVVEPYNPMIRMPFTFPWALARHHIDVVHVQYIAPPICPAKIVVSVHDISFERYPHYFTPAGLRQMRLMVPLTIRHAEVVLTLSDFSRQDIIRRYNVSPDKIVVAGGAASSHFRPISDHTQLQAARTKYNTGDHFILSVGNLQPRKNIQTLIDAYIRLRKAGRTGDKLVLVGRKAWLWDDIFASARDSGFADAIVFTDFVSDDDLVALYSAADVFVYPSVFEGFGLPPLEAMACGTPVVTSNTTSLPEVVGDAGLMVNPLDPQAFADAISTLLHTPELHADLSRRGIERAARFSWDDTAKTIVQQYHRAAGHN